MEFSDKQIEHFAEKVNKQGTTECWEWLGARYYNGYGIAKINGVNMSAHRVSWQLFFSDIPDGQFVLHRCDNPSCVNPYHLFLGTQSDNLQDCYKKERGPRQKLSIEEVKYIRALHAKGLKQIDLAEMFNVSPSNVNGIIKRRHFNYIK